MRKGKWVAVGLALVAVGVSTYLFSQPAQRKGTVGYHKEQYLYRMGIIEKRIGNQYPAFAQRFLLKTHTQQAVFHYRQLMQAGYFEERVFSISNRFFYTPMLLRQHLTNTDDRLVHLISVSSNAVSIRAPREGMAEVEAAIRKFDGLDK